MSCLTYVRFDLSSLPSDAVVAKASLRLYLDEIVHPGWLGLHVILEPWDELKVLPGSAPSILPTSFASVPILKSFHQNFITIDVTSIVELWVDGEASNYGIALLPGDASSIHVLFNSKENRLTGHPPELEVVLHAKPGSKGQLGPMGDRSHRSLVGASGEDGSLMLLQDGTRVYYKDGNLGLGTDRPRARLDVSGGSVRASRNARQYLELSGFDASGGLIEMHSSASNKKKLRIKSLHNGGGEREAGETAIVFSVGDRRQPIQALNISENGEIGIRRLKPEYTLDVGGTIGISGKRVIDLDGRWVGDYATGSISSESIAPGSITVEHLDTDLVDLLAPLLKARMFKEASKDLLLYYSFDTVLGDLVPDQSGCGNTGYIQGAEQVSSGILGSAMRFEKGDQIKVGNILDLGNAITTITVCAWVKISKTQSGSEMVVVGKLQTPRPYTGWRLGTFRDEVIADLTARWPEQSVSFSDTKIFDDKWHYLCGVFFLP